MQVHYGEGVANHTGPESCAVYREVCGEALTGVRTDQPLSRETFLIQDAEVVAKTGSPEFSEFLARKRSRTFAASIACDSPWRAGSVALRGIIVQFWHPRDAQMTKPIIRDAIYRRRRFDTEIIELCVRWYITYRLSYRDLVAMMAERGVVVSHTTILML